MSAATIGGKLDMAVLTRLHFPLLDRDEQRTAIRRLAALGQAEHAIAAATGLSVEQIRRALSEVSHAL